MHVCKFWEPRINELLYVQYHGHTSNTDVDKHAIIDCI